MPEHFSIQLAQRAARRRADSVAIELRKGLTGLATIATTAALWGLAGTCWAMMQGFGAGSFTNSSLLVAIMTQLANALLFNAAGLVLAVTGTLAHRIASDRLAECETEMALAVSLLPDALRDLRSKMNAAERQARLVRIQFQRGIPSLAAIAAVAPLCGLLGTCNDIHTALTACVRMNAVILLLGESLVWAAWGILLAVVARLGHDHLSRKLTQCEAEMALAIGQLPDALR